MHDDFYQMYLEELGQIVPCTETEEYELLETVVGGDAHAKRRLIEGNLSEVLEYAREYENRGLPMGDLVQEANMALTIAAGGYQEGAWTAYLEHQIRSALESAIDEQQIENHVEEEITARINVLKDISQIMTEELDREPSVQELGDRMKMSAEEIKDIMKLALDAMSVSGE